MPEEILNSAPLFLLVAARCAGLIFTLPLFSMRTVSRTAKIALVGYMAFFLLGKADYSVYKSVITEDGTFDMYYILLLAGEAMIGVIMGFYVQIIFAAFSTAAQFFAFQMGFSAASAYDALSQVENPLMGQFFNLVAMLIFIHAGWFQKLFLTGLSKSFEALNVFGLVNYQKNIVTFLLKGLTNLFADAIIIALPIMGTLVLITICTGLLSKAAPQMNLLSEGFPIMILLAFGLIIILFGDIVNFFGKAFNTGLSDLFMLFDNIGNGGS